MRLRPGRPALLAAALAILAATAGIAAMALGAPWSGKPPAPTAPEAPATRACLEGVADAEGALQGLDVHASSSLYRTQNRTVDYDNQTVLAAVALARATRAPLDPEEVRNFTLERIEVCTFALSAGIARNASSLARVVAFRTVVEHNATLSSDNAMRAILLNATGVPIDPHDVISFRRHEDTRRTFDRVLDLSSDPLLIALASSEPEDRPLLRAVAEDAP